MFDLSNYTENTENISFLIKSLMYYSILFDEIYIRTNNNDMIKFIEENLQNDVKLEIQKKEYSKEIIITKNSLKEIEVTEDLLDTYI